MGDVDVMMHLGGFAWPATDTGAKNESSPARRIKLAADVTRPPGLPLRQRSLGAMPGIARYRSDSTTTEPRLSICSTSGTVYESVVVVGHMYGSDKVVYYLLEVRSWEMPLEGYVVRRRYNDFLKFHQELTQCMPSQRPRSSTSIGFGYSSLLCNPLTKAIPEASPLWSPVRTDDGRTDQRKGSWISEGSSNSQVEENDSRSSAPTALTGVSSYNNDAVLPLDAVKFNLAGRPWLPPMPSGGMFTMFTTRHALINYRIEQFNHILAAVMSDKSSDVAKLLMNFIQEKPGTQAQTYTNLSEYAPIDIPFNVERYARRRAMSVGKRQLRDQVSSPNTGGTDILSYSASKDWTKFDVPGEFDNTIYNGEGYRVDWINLPADVVNSGFDAIEELPHTQRRRLQMENTYLFELSPRR
ncbi:Phox homologous domain [Phytophthora cactorum]|nr:Phox homologous domain [Phytophthora cactorum]